MKGRNDMKRKSFIVIVVILVLVIFGLCAFIIYDKDLLNIRDFVKIFAKIYVFLVLDVSNCAKIAHAILVIYAATISMSVMYATLTKMLFILYF